MNRGSARVRRALGALTAVLAAVLIVLGGAGTAAAHAELDSTDPAPDSVVPRQPSAVTLTFSEGVTLPADSLRVLDPAGERVDTGTRDMPPAGPRPHGWPCATASRTAPTRWPGR
ncbi:copper resistance CopC family protein [Streptomyces stelliscabiei]|uniref:copper resistance CopC family protein n=1 Tax=Streptomyces stelliscabiei TaxID=146820 RepID=UPI002FEE74D6